jgi:hypothetical protein
VVGLPRLEKTVGPPAVLPLAVEVGAQPPEMAGPPPVLPPAVEVGAQPPEMAEPVELAPTYRLRALRPARTILVGRR